MKKLELAGEMGRGIFILLDSSDFTFASKWAWSISPKGYAIRTDRTSGVKKTVYLHKEIACRMGIGDSLQADHRDGDKLDCRRRNIRGATNHQNQANVTRQKNNTTGFKGVTRKGQDRFVARIGVHYKRIHLGYFRTAEEAHAAYRIAAKKYFGEFARY